MNWFELAPKTRFVVVFGFFILSAPQHSDDRQPDKNSNIIMKPSSNLSD